MQNETEEPSKEQNEKQEEETTDLPEPTPRNYKPNANRKIMNMCKFFAHGHKCKFESSGKRCLQVHS